MSRLTPIKAIRAKCIDCSGFELKRVRECPFDGINDEACPLYPLRMGKGGRATLKKIRNYCLWCCNGQWLEVKLCPSLKCPLWVYRFGKRHPQESPSLTEIRTTEAHLGTVKVR